jgi:hypothetical protein
MIPLLLPNVLIVLIVSVSVVLADDFKTLDGKEYKNAEVMGVAPGGFMIKTASGEQFSKINSWELPQEVQERFRQKLKEDQKRRDEQTQAVLAKAQSIRIPTVELLGVTPQEAVQLLVAQCPNDDPGGTGFTITIPSDTSPRIMLLLHDVTLFEALTAVAQQTGMSVSAVPNGFVIYRKPAIP